MAKRKRITPGSNMPAQFAEFRREMGTALQIFATEIASRRRDPYENNYLGILENTDPLVRERGEDAYDLYKDLMRDGKVFSSYQKRLYTMLARPWQITPVEESELGLQHAQIISNMLKRVRFD